MNAFVKLDEKSYTTWVRDLKSRIQKAQICARGACIINFVHQARSAKLVSGLLTNYLVSFRICAASFCTNYVDHNYAKEKN